MSKIGKKPIMIPEKVDVTISAGFVSVKGPKGELKKPIPPMVSISQEDKQILIKPEAGTGREGSTYWGLTRSLVQNMIIGVTTGFEKVLEFQGVGYKAAVKGTGLELGLGFSHPIVYPGRDGITFQTDKGIIKVQGPDKELVGQVAAEIKTYRKPEPYKGSGIRYQGEFIRRKAGKKAAASG